MGDKIIGERIAQARKVKGLTQIQLGGLMGYEGKSGERTVQRWENGEVLVPPRQIRKLAQLLDLTLEDLIP